MAQYAAEIDTSLIICTVKPGCDPSNSIKILPRILCKWHSPQWPGNPFCHRSRPQPWQHRCSVCGKLDWRCHHRDRESRRFQSGAYTPDTSQHCQSHCAGPCHHEQWAAHSDRLATRRTVVIPCSPCRALPFWREIKLAWERSKVMTQNQLICFLGTVNIMSSAQISGEHVYKISLWF